MSRLLVLLLLVAGCAAHDLGYLQVDLVATTDGARVTVSGDTPLLAALEPPRPPEGFAVRAGPAEAARRVFTLAGSRRLDHRDTIHLPWPGSGAAVVARWEDGTVGRAIVPRRGATIVLALGRLGAGSASWTRVLREHLALGLDHILAGLDHLAFVAGLLLLVHAGGGDRRVRRLVATVTAFTLGHSLSLAAVTLGLGAPAGAAIEVLIALSIVILAAEVVHALRRRPGWSCRHPALMAAGFGLLHGLGFAGALAELGLPRDAVVPALIGFNLGVEAGQLLVVALLLLLAHALRPALAARAPSLALGGAYALGVLAASWTLQRVIGA